VVEHVTFNHGVDGSIPSGLTNLLKHLLESAEERNVFGRLFKIARATLFSFVLSRKMTTRGDKADWSECFVGGASAAEN
jgi:hypothetical protein